MASRLLVVLAVAVLTSGCGNDVPAPSRAAGTGTVVESSARGLKNAILGHRPVPVVVNYWATWCDPCKKEMPLLVDAAARYKGRIAFVGVDVEDDLASARAFVKRYGVTFRSYALSRAEVQRTQDILGLPVTQFYSSDGDLAFVHQGEISAGDLEDKIGDVLRTSAPAEG